VEDLYESGKFNGSEERFFNMVEKTASMRPVSSLANSNNLSNTLKTSLTSLFQAFGQWDDKRGL